MAALRSQPNFPPRHCGSCASRSATARDGGARAGAEGPPPLRPREPSGSSPSPSMASGFSIIRGMADSEHDPGQPEAERVDVWLDVACLFKTRSLAQAACRGGKVE